MTARVPNSDPSGRSIGTVILAAGASARMGRPKLLLPWRGTSVVGHLIEQWQALGAAQMAVVCRPADEGLAAELDRLGFPRRHHIHNPQAERGMFSSIQCAGQWPGWQPGLTAWVIVLGDQPHLQLATLRRLLTLHQAHPNAVCQPAFAGRARHPVLLPGAAFAELAHTRAATLKEFLAQTASPRVECAVADAGLALDLDRPEDYATLALPFSPEQASGGT